jgi:tRNA nucleotidyltransferase (CCA-adding enzyme)
MDRFSVPRILSEFSQAFTASGHKCFLVGGAVRDMALGKQPEDYDIASDALPAEVMSLFRSVIPTGIKHGTVTVRFKGHSIEVTTFRTEADYDDARHPSTVSYSKDLSEDLKRRDFTMNALALDCASGELRDEHGGRADLSSKLVRAIGDPVERFTEDGLRPLRAIRFSAQLDFDIEERTFAAISRCHARTRMVSPERVRDELCKMLLSPRPFKAMKLLEDSGLMSIILPELAALRGLEQSPPHSFDALDHSLHACQGSPSRLDQRLAALFHDLGKKDSRIVKADGGIGFHGHERISEAKSREIMLRLKFPNALIDSVCRLVRHHMTRYEEDWSDASVRRFIARVGEEYYPDLLDILEADHYGLEGRHSGSDGLRRFRDRRRTMPSASRTWR